MKYTIGYDIGSSSVKIALVEADTNKSIAVVTEPQDEMPIHAEKAHWAEQIHKCGGIICVREPKEF